jgi:hypothetical protein
MSAITPARSRLGLFALELAIAVAIGLVPLFVSPAPTHAQATRTWVSGVGDDANPCSRTSPCKTFAGAISKTAPGGEIDALDPGGFGAVTITKSITLDGSGTFASILVSGTNAINVNAATNDIVVIRGLSLQGLGGVNSGLTGIDIIQAKEVYVENTAIEGFGNNGIVFQSPVAGAALFVTNTDIRNNGFAIGSGTGIFADSTSASTVTATIDKCRFENTTIAVSARNNVRMTIRDSIFSNNATGILVAPTAGTSVANLESVVAVFNGQGLQAGGGGGSGLVRMSNTTVIDNSRGLVIQPGGNVRSFTNNQIDGNSTFNGPPNVTVPQQ